MHRKRMESSKRIDAEYDKNHWIKPVYFPRAEASLSEMRISVRREKKKRSLTDRSLLVMIRECGEVDTSVCCVGMTRAAASNLDRRDR